jgi:hypothetical protein
VGLVNWVWLCGLRVFVDQPAEDRASLNAGGGEIDCLRWSVRWLQVEGSMGPAAVVVDGVLGQDTGQVPFADDEQAVCAVASYRSGPAFRVGVGPWCLWWYAEHVDTSGGERRGELRLRNTVSMVKKSHARSPVPGSQELLPRRS